MIQPENRRLVFSTVLFFCIIVVAILDNTQYETFGWFAAEKLLITSIILMLHPGAVLLSLFGMFTIAFAVGDSQFLLDTLVCVLAFGLRLAITKEKFT